VIVAFLGDLGENCGGETTIVVTKLSNAASIIFDFLPEVERAVSVGVA
jgi:hypothetical protein